MKYFFIIIILSTLNFNTIIILQYVNMIRLKGLVVKCYVIDAIFSFSVILRGV